MGIVVAFSYSAWLAAWPEFTPYSIGPPVVPSGPVPVTSGQASSYFAMATAIHANDGSGPVNNAGLQLTMLNALTAHFAKLLATPLNATQASDLVGRISDASEGSVSVRAQNDYPPGTAQWFQQTKYGSAYWQMAAQFRTMRYAPRRARGGPVRGYGGLV